MRIPRRILPIIILSQFFCTSLWFAANAVMENLIWDFNLKESDLGHVTSAVQFGFIVGTLLFALFTISDRYSPSKVFLFSAILGALSNLIILCEGNSLISIVISRFLTGFFLAGIYPVGMKIAADYYKKGLGLSLGFLVGALVLGTAFPHFLQEFFSSISWHLVIKTTSFLALVGGVLVYFLIPNGPFRSGSKGVNLKVIFIVFKNSEFRKAAFGYFGHMWELYAFWAFVPVILSHFILDSATHNMSISLWSFLIIAIGSLGCIMGGYYAQKVGSNSIALIALILSGLCCIISPLIFSQNSTLLFLTFMLIWGIMVIADSPQLSTMVANLSDPKYKGSALTIVNCIGFTITIISIELLTFLNEIIPFQFMLMVLAIGPAVGIISLVTRNADNTN